MDVPALTKEAAFIDLCDTFNLPLVFLQDVPGLMIGSDAERGGILAGYESVVARLARARVPKVAVVVRKAYGGGHFALGGRPTHPDLVLAWPTAEMGFMAPDDRRPHRPPAPAGGGARRARARRRTTRSSPSSRPSGRTSPSPGRRRRTSTSTTSSTRAGRARRSRPGSTSRGAAGRGSGRALDQEDPCQRGPLAHICLARPATSTRRSPTGRRSSPSSTPASSSSRSCVDHWEAGEDVMSLGDVRQPGRLRDPAPLPAERRAARPPAREAGRGRPPRLLHRARPARRGRSARRPEG